MKWIARGTRPGIGLGLRTIAILLSAVAGAVDAIGFLLLFHMFVAHMSGNSAALGAYLGRGEWSMAFNHLFPIPLFVLGIVAGTVLNGILANHEVRSPFACVAAIEVLLLVLFMLFGFEVYSGGVLRIDSAGAFYSLAALLVTAMGLQNATLQKVSHADLHTTYVTGTLNNLAHQSLRYVQWLVAQAGSERDKGLLWLVRSSKNEPACQGMILSGGLWVLYIVGAVLGSLAKQRWGPGALLLPILVLGTVVLVDFVRPMEPTSK
jgi:uncharacterized membrane protein YoaK (UPF0700 family)